MLVLMYIPVPTSYLYELCERVCGTVAHHGPLARLGLYHRHHLPQVGDLLPQQRPRLIITDKTLKATSHTRPRLV